MKKLFIFLFTIGTVTTLQAQSWETASRNNIGYNDHRGFGREKDFGNGDRHTSNWEDRNDRFEKQDRYEKEKHINRGYRQDRNTGRNNRYINARERERQIAMEEREKSQKRKSFTGGVVTGAIAGVILGVLIAGQ